MSEFADINLSNPAVCTKYTTAAEIVNKALKNIIAASVDGAKILDICNAGDAELTTEFGKVYNKKVDGLIPIKGISFPVSITVNELNGAFSPVAWEPEAAATLKKGDLVKIDIGGQIDGFPVIAGHSFVIGESEVTGRKADALEAIKTITETVHRLVRPGNKASQVTAAITQIAEAYGVTPLNGILSHEMSQHVLDGQNAFPAKNIPGEHFDDFEFQTNQVFGIDVAVSTGSGKVKPTEIKCTVYKRDLSVNANLRTDNGKKFLHEINTKFPTMAFSLRQFDEKVARVGVSEAIRANLLEYFPVSTETKGEFIAQTKMTLAILPSGTKKIGGLPLTENNTASAAKELSQEIKDILALPLTKKAAKKQN